MNRGKMSGWVDHVIYNSKYFIMIECKFDKDFLKPGQIETARLLSSIASINKTIHYFQIKTIKEAQSLHDRILKGDL